MTQLLDEILAARAVHSCYQPIVELDTGRIVGFEALARGPKGSALERPDLLFDVARSCGRLGELDWACRIAALEGALAAGMDRSTALFVNMEPEAASVPPPAHAWDVVKQAQQRLNVMVEVTERALVEAPAGLLRALSFVRDLGWGVALDDVGAEVASLALMPFLRPDVIKLDLHLVQQQPDRDIAAIVSAVDAQAERTGAVVLAEGIETEEHLDVAAAMGATIGQGWHFARPGDLPARLHELQGGLTPAPPPPPPSLSPMAAALLGRPPRRSTKALLVEMSLHLERQALDQGATVVVISAFQTADRFTAATRSRYRDLARRSAFVAAMGVGMEDEPAPGVHGNHLPLGDPLLDEWAVAIVSPHFAAALTAIDLHDAGPESTRRFDYVLTYRRELALAVASSMMARVDPMRTLSPSAAPDLAPALA